MNFSRIIVSVALFLLICSLSDARFVASRSQTFTSAVRGNFLLSRANPRSRRNNRVFDRAVRLVQRSFSSCSPSVCFAIDGSDALSTSQFETQKSFVQLAAATLGGLDGAKFAAVQYAGSVANPIEISPLVDAETQGVDFLFDVAATSQANSNPTFVEGGIQYCIDEFLSNPMAVQKIVILGDGQTNLGSDNAITVAQNWDNLGAGNNLCAGIIGHGNQDFFVDLVGGVNTDVRRPANWNLLIDIIFDLVEEICGA